MKKRILTAICLLLILPCFILPASATPPSISHIYGEMAIGAMNLDEESLVVLENMSLTYDLSEFPTELYTENEFSAKGSRLTVKYSLYNPTETDAVANIALPIVPPTQDYIEISPADCSVKLNGEAADTVIRHTYHGEGYPFHEDSDPYRVIDGYIENGFFNLDTKVTKYTFRISDVDKEAYPLAQFGIDMAGGGFKTAIFLDADADAYNHNDGYRLCGSIGMLKSDTIDLYAFGDPYIGMLQWKFYENPMVSDDETIYGKAELISQSSMTFSEFVYEGYNPERGISEMDWYNALITQFDSSTNYGRPFVYLTGREENYEGCFMSWQQVKIPISPGERAELEISLPIFPNIGIITDPYTYDYRFLRFNRMRWAEDGKIDITINTDYLLLSGANDLGGFTKTETGYETSADNAGQIYGQIFFTLCEVENPESTGGFGPSMNCSGPSAGILDILITIISIPFVVIYRIIEAVVEFIKSIF